MNYQEQKQDTVNQLADRPRPLVAGWHELRIERALSIYRHGLLFVVEGHVLRSIVPDYAGEEFFFACNLLNLTGKKNMLAIEHTIRDKCVLEVIDRCLERMRRRLLHNNAEDGEDVIRYSSVILLADTHEEQNKLGTYLSTDWEHPL